jgi:hypothetical protein
MKRKSKILTLSFKDGVKGLLVSVITVVISSLYALIEAGVFPTTWNDWKVILLAAAGSGLSYIIKNWLTNSDDKFLKREEPRMPV